MLRREPVQPCVGDRVVGQPSQVAGTGSIEAPGTCTVNRRLDASRADLDLWSEL